MPELNHLKLSDLTRKIASAITDAFANQSYWVVADISDHKYYGEKGHHYFSLIEKAPNSQNIIAKIAATSWSQGSERIRNFERITGQAFTTGIHVLVRVTVSYHEVYGLKTTLVDIDPNFTIGQLEKQRLETLQKLLVTFPEFIRKVGDAYITKNKQLQLNPVIQRIAVITSLNSAGYLDFQHTLDTNPFGYQFKTDTYYAAVQGIDNARDIYQRFIDIVESKLEYDVVVLIRGGGSQTDFLIFDTFQLGEIVARFPIPVITGIGHLINETIVDLMAHTPLKTPTKVAEFIISYNRSFEDEIIELQKNIVIKTQQFINLDAQRIHHLQSFVVNRTRDTITHHRELLVRFQQTTSHQSVEILHVEKEKLMWLITHLTTKPALILSNKQTDLKNHVGNFHLFTQKYFANMKGYLAHHTTIMRMMSPESILKKGFALVYQEGKIISNPKKLKAGNRITVVLSKAELITEIKEKKDRDGKELNV